MMEDSAVTYVAQVPGRHSMRMATSGVAVLAEFLDKLEGVGRLDRTMGSIKQRARGVTAGEVLVGLVTDPKCRSGSGVGRAHRCRTRARLAGRRHNCLSGGFSWGVLPGKEPALGDDSERLAIEVVELEQ